MSPLTPSSSSFGTIKRLLLIWILVVIGWLQDITYARCINWCNQRGVCTAPDESGTCDCTIGYGNDDCSIKLCPKAYDPLTINDNMNRRTISLTTGLTFGNMSGFLVFSMGPESINIPIGIRGNECTMLLGMTTISIPCLFFVLYLLYVHVYMSLMHVKVYTYGCAHKFSHSLSLVCIYVIQDVC